MKMSPLLMASFWVCRTSLGAFVATSNRCVRHGTVYLFSVSTADVNMGVSRLETLQIMLSKCGAPGSKGCRKKEDLLPIFLSSHETDDGADDTPELISTLTGMDEYVNLHPHLYPLARSKDTGNVVCAIRRAYADDAKEWYENSSTAPWPIVEAQIGGPGMRLLALNSEYMMRRIVCECDVSGENKELIDLYNNGMKKSVIKDKGLNQPYVQGSVEKLGYGVDKYVLLRVGPFPDIYESLALGHAKKGDESSALISAEAANNKISGFASTFLFYAKLLSSFSNRGEEARDAARMCLRLPLPSIGLTADDFRDVAILGQIAEESDSTPEVMTKLLTMYEKMREHEKDEDPRSAASMTPEQAAIDEANYLLDKAALTGGKWSEVRPKLAKIYQSVGRNDMAHFVNPKNS